jgi:hypothetical protein
LIHCELTSHYQPFGHHKSSQTTLEFNFTHSTCLNHSEIERVSQPSLHVWWSVCCCICRPWWDVRFSGWHWNYVWLISIDRLVGLLFWSSLFSLVNHLQFSLVLLNVTMQTRNCWMRWWVLSYDLGVDNEK